MSKKYLVVLDIDGTLLDKRYLSTSPTIYSVIEQMQQEGHIFILNSNRSIDDILPIAKHFGITGPIIGENGCIIYNQRSGESLVLVDMATQQQMMKLKKALFDIINQNFDRAYFAITDTTAFNKYAETQDLPLDKDFYFLLNEFRKFSLSIHVRDIRTGSVEQNPAITKNFCILIKDYIVENKLDLVHNYLGSFSNVLVCSNANDKTKALKKVELHYPKHTKVIIGDDILDKPAMEEIDYFFTVNNATKEVKAVAHYVASQDITKGVEEILLKIDQLIQ